MKHFLIQSHLIKHSGTQSGLEDTHSALEHSKHSESTRELGHSEGTRALMELGLLDT